MRSPAFVLLGLKIRALVEFLKSLKQAEELLLFTGGVYLIERFVVPFCAVQDKLGVRSDTLRAGICAQKGCNSDHGGIGAQRTFVSFSTPVSIVSSDASLNSARHHFEVMAFFDEAIMTNVGIR